MENTNGTVYWVTGLSGAGKTTIGTLLYNRIKQNRPVVILDGDRIRRVYGEDIGYSPEDRIKMAMRNSRLCELLSSQGIDVVCCTIAMFHSVRAWNRENIPSYKEIYLKVTAETLKKRDQKGLYSGVTKGSAHNVMGVDITFEEPISPDLIIHNDGDETPQEVLSDLEKLLNI